MGEKSPARVAGIQPGDQVVAIDGKAVAAWDDMVSFIADGNGAILEIQVERNGTPRLFRVTPEVKGGKNLFGETVNRYMIGVAAAGEVGHIPLNPSRPCGRGRSEPGKSVNSPYFPW